MNHGYNKLLFNRFLTINWQPIDYFILFNFQIRRIFDGIGVEMTTDAFEKIWEQASTRHPAGLVMTSLIF